MNATTRGALIFVGIIVFISVMCVGLPIVFFGSTGTIAALPVIEVPGEVLTDSGFPFIFFGWDNLTNTWMATIVADVIVIIFALLAWNASKGWTKEVPGKFQAWVETIIDALYGFTKQMAGDTPKVRNILFPLVGTLFIFLLTANWMSLMPGIDSVGEMHCAHGAQSGYPRIGHRLYNTIPLNAGISVSAEQEAQCKKIKKGDYPESLLAFDADGDGVPSYDAAQEEEIDAIVAALASDDLSESERDDLMHDYEDATGFPKVIYPLTAAELEGGVQPYSFVVTPFVRPAATDLNLTIGLSLVSFFFIQYFGISSLGLGYFQKFINLRALGNASKNPIGAVDFVVGIFEIVSEFAKVISLAFRLFGNIFAGAVLIFVMHFLISTGLPIIFFGLETIVGFAQAAVFAVLTLIFCAQAMESHHHDDDEHGEAHH